LRLTLRFRDVKDIAALPAPGKGPLTIPTARDIRLRLTPVCKPDDELKYFGSQEVRRGMPIRIATRKHSSNERALFVPQPPANRFQAILLQPDPPPGGNQSFAQAAAGKQQEAPADLAQRLAQQLGLDVDGLTLFGRPGRRVVFGCSRGLRHVLSADRSAITFASKADLTHQWISVLMLQIDRDWTWDASADISFQVTREMTRTLTGVVEKEAAGAIEAARSVSAAARQNADTTVTDLFFIDAIDPKPPAGEFPSELEIAYTVKAFFKGTPAADDPLQLETHLPMAAPPTQTPRLASAGIALSPYVRAGDYSSTAVRQRMLWLEFEQPVLDKRDRYFARVAAYAPDPMLTSLTPIEPPAPEEAPLPVDPEPIRVIVPGQSDDRAGLDAMQPLLPAQSERHFLVPLPPGLTDVSPELFGFFVYEIRAGHAEGWSTAQGRFGPALRVTGVQHPAPPLSCQVARRRQGIIATTVYAMPVREGRNLLPYPPGTEIWALLYVQVTQLDAADRRNVLLSQTRCEPARRTDIRETPDVIGVGRWDQSEVELLLAGLALPKNSALSVLAVELLPEVEQKSDPLGGDLGHVRILRTSPLVRVPPICT
jgi:hypothetical protein